MYRGMEVWHVQKAGKSGQVARWPEQETVIPRKWHIFIIHIILDYYFTFTVLMAESEWQMAGLNLNVKWVAVFY